MFKIGNLFTNSDVLQSTPSTSLNPGVEHVVRFIEKGYTQESVLSRLHPDEAEYVRQKEPILRAKMIEHVRAERFVRVFDELPQFDAAGSFRLYEELWPSIPEALRADCLRAVWIGGRDFLPSVRRCLQLFATAPALKRTVPSDLPAEVRIFSGVAARSRRGAHARMRHVLWSLDPERAESHAYNFPGGSDTTEFVGVTTIHRDHILAFFNSDRRPELVVHPCAIGRIDVADVSLIKAA